MTAATPESASVQPGDVVDVAFCPQINEFKGFKSVQLNLVDIRPSCKADCSAELHGYAALRNGDFETFSFPANEYDLVYSAATIQWIPEEIAYPKCFSLLRPGGMLAMMYMRSDYQSPNPALYDKIQQVYAAHYKPDTPYRNGNFRYDHADDYGFEKGEKYEFRTQRILTAEEYVGYCGTHCDHMTIPEPDRSLFFDGLHKAVLEAGDRIVFQDTFILHLAKKPE